MIQPWICPFFDEESHTFSYVVTDPKTKHCVIVDSVLDYDTASATTSTQHADQIITFVKDNQLHVEWILETHMHADHLSAAQYLKQQLGGRVGISHHIQAVQQTFSQIYHLDYKKINAAQPFDYLFADDEHFNIGNLEAYNIPTPGHTPACLSYVIGDAVFVGDTLFMPDYGTARCDFPKGSAAQLYDSVQKLYRLPKNYRVFLCHDYLPAGRENYQCETSIAAQMQNNIHIHTGTDKLTFIAMRHERDTQLAMPQLMLSAIQVNMQAGQLPEAEDNGIQYLKIPLNFFKSNK